MVGLDEQQATYKLASLLVQVNQAMSAIYSASMPGSENLVIGGCGGYQAPAPCVPRCISTLRSVYLIRLVCCCCSNFHIPSWACACMRQPIDLA